MKKRELDVVVISDVHLGTHGCHAIELVNYLKSISPQLLILNGDIVDGWQFSKRFFPQAHLQVIKEILNHLSNGTRVIYITGNHDEMLRRYSDFSLGNFFLTDKMIMEINNKMVWVFHGDVFDNTTKGSAKLIAKLGGYSYDLLILLNRFINWFLKKTGRPKLSFSKKIKNSIKKAIKWISDFEQTAAELAIAKNYDYVICGHIHQPQIREVKTAEGKVTYLNSGDWVENLTALEYADNEWTIYQYEDAHFENTPVIKMDSIPVLNVVTDDISLFIHSLINKY